MPAPASAFERLIARLGPAVDDPDEETFLLFADERPQAQNLGFIDAHAPVLDVTVAGRDLTVHQSPAVLTSNRSGGTTGAVLWKISPAVAAWLAWPGNLLFGSGLLGPDSAVLELGCGIGGIIGLTLTGKGRRNNDGMAAASASTKKRLARSGARRTGAASAVLPTTTTTTTTTTTFANANTVGRYVLTDQSYVAKFLLKNLEANGAGDVDEDQGHEHGPGHSHSHHHGSHLAPAKKKPGSTNGSSVYFRPLDWETDEPTASLLRTTLDRGASPSAGERHGHGAPRPAQHTSFDAVLACDCIYNEALVEPLVQTFADACRLREKDREDDRDRSGGQAPLPPTICLVAQQLRDPDVLTAWLTAFHAAFRVWRVPDELLSPELCPGAGFAVHIGVLRTE